MRAVHWNDRQVPVLESNLSVFSTTLVRRLFYSFTTSLVLEYQYHFIVTNEPYILPSSVAVSKGQVTYKFCSLCRNISLISKFYPLAFFQQSRILVIPMWNYKYRTGKWERSAVMKSIWLWASCSILVWLLNVVQTWIRIQIPFINYLDDLWERSKPFILHSKNENTNFSIVLLRERSKNLLIVFKDDRLKIS